MKTTYAVAITAIMTIMLISGAQAAMANPGHSLGAPVPTSKTIGPGGSILVTVTVSPAQPTVPVVGDYTFHVLDVAPMTTSVGNFACAGPGGQALTGAAFLGAGDVQTILDDDGTAGVQAVAAQLTGNGPPFATFSVGPTVGNPIIAGLGAQAYLTGTALTPLVGTPQWLVQFAPGPMPNGVVGSIGIPNAVIGIGNTLWSCGFDDFNGDGIDNSVAGFPTDARGLVSESYTIETPVGGELVSISTTSLLLAGISTNAMWVLTGLIIVAGAAFTVLRFQPIRRAI